MRLLALTLALWTGSCGLPRADRTAATPPVRVVTWNVLVGFQDHRVGDPWLPGSDRHARAHAWLERAAPDIIGWQELNGYSPDRLKRETAGLGHVDAVLLKERGYDLGLSSRWPIEVVERHLDGMHHGLLHARTNDIDVFVVHLCPSDQAVRLREIEQIGARVRKVLAADRSVLVMGDFNSCTNLDDPLFGQEARRWYTGWRYPLNEAGFPDGIVLDRAFDIGLVDPWASRRSQDHAAFRGRPRIDYILLSPDLDAQCVNVEWVDDPSLDHATDHPPVIVDLDIPRS